MTVQFLFWVIVAMFIGSNCLSLHIGHHFGREDRPEPRHAKPATEPYYPPGTRLDEIYPELEADRFDLAVAAFIEADAARLERLATDTDRGGVLFGPFDAGTLPAWPGQVSDTGELRALAYAGEHEEIAAHVADYKKEIDES
jgi:hypothetical protein